LVPFHPHDGLQQSQKRVVKPAVPEVGGTQGPLLELLADEALELPLVFETFVDVALDLPVPVEDDPIALVRFDELWVPLTEP
jgi:hypothetical protein